MTKFQTKLTTAFATGAVLLNALAPITFAETTLTVSGNGSGSANNVSATKTNTTTVVQDNTLNVNNNVDVDADTGNNSASDNTGGDVKIDTGHAVTDIKIKNLGNHNSAVVDNCCDNGDTEVTISGNGSDTDNNVDLTKANVTTLFQTNDATIDNDVDVDADTGDNDADDNTGGDVTIKTGTALTDIVLKNDANHNFAVLGGGNGEGGELSAWITGNGSDSDNDITLTSANIVTLTQDNVADIDNDIDVDAETGDNDADDNTGGDVLIDTGDAVADLTVDTKVNFNAASIDDCGCLTDLKAVISGNGSDSESDITHASVDTLTAFMTNDADLDNDLDVDGDTGDNDADDNTGAVDADSDPSIETGTSATDVNVKNEGNINTLGDLSDVLDHVEFDFDLSSWFGFFFGHSNS